MRAKRYDLCFLWVDSSTSAAIAALAEIRARAATRHLPVVVVGLKPDEDLILRAVKAGASAFLSYPFNASDVEAAIGIARS